MLIWVILFIGVFVIGAIFGYGIAKEAVAVGKFLFYIFIIAILIILFLIYSHVHQEHLENESPTTEHTYRSIKSIDFEVYTNDLKN